MSVLAHGGHWASSLVYGAPVIVMGGWMGWTWLRNRRKGGTPAEDQRA